MRGLTVYGNVWSRAFLYYLLKKGDKMACEQSQNEHNFQPKFHKTIFTYCKAADYHWLYYDIDIVVSNRKCEKSNQFTL